MVAMLGGVSVSSNEQQDQGTPAYVQRIVRHIKGLVIVLGALAALVVAIIGFWDPLEKLICDKAGLCSGESGSGGVTEPSPPPPSACDPENIETCL